MDKSLIILILMLLTFSLIAQDKPIQVNNEDYIVISNMRVEGNKKTRTNVILTESKLRVGDSITINTFNKELLKSRQNILNLGLFNDTEISIEKWRKNNHLDLVVDVDERWYLYPIPKLKIPGLTFAEWKDVYDYDVKRLAYGLSTRHYNLTGRGDVANFSFLTGFQKQYNLGYTLNGIDKERHWGIGLSANYLKNKATIIKAEENTFFAPLAENDVIEFKSIQAAITRRKVIRRRHALGIRLSETKVANEIIEEVPDFFAENNTSQKVGSIFYGLAIENRDLAEYPTKGNSLSAGMSYANSFNSDYNNFSANAKFDYYYAIQNKHLFSAGAFGRIMTAKDVPFYNITNSALQSEKLPRGYNSYRIFPKNYLTLKTEYKYNLLDKKINNIPILGKRFEPTRLRILPKAFIDLSSTSSNQYIDENPLNNDFLYAYGAGLDIVSIYNIPLRIELSNNNLSETNFNFGIGKAF